MKKYAFGTIIVTSVGMLGYEHVFAPIPRIFEILFKLLAFTGAAVIITVGSTLKKPLVVENEIKIRDVINVTLTLDHRFTDGARAAPLYQKFNKLLQDTEKYLAFYEEKTLLHEVQ